MTDLCMVAWIQERAHLSPVFTTWQILSCCDLFQKKKENHVHSKLLFLFFTSSTYLISVSFLLFIHLTLFIQTLLTNHESSLPLTHHQPQPLQKTPTTPPWLVKTYVKSYFPLIKYSSVLQMYAWITCHTLSLLRMAPR